MDSESTDRLIERRRFARTMTRLRSEPDTSIAGNRPAQVYAAAVDVLTYALTVIVAVRVAIDRPAPWGLAVGALAAFAGVYVAGSRTGHRRHHRAAAGWFAALVVLWAGVMVVDTAGVFLGFAMFFVALDRFALRTGVTLVAVATALIGFVEFADRGDMSAAPIVGPAIGATLAVVVTVGYQSLARENEQRRLLIAELKATRADLAASERERGALEERERLARDIHDTVAQGMAGVIIQLANAERDVRSGDDTSVLDHVMQARRSAIESLEDVRRVVRDLTPADLDNATLEHAIARLCAKAEGPGNPVVTFRVTGDKVSLPTSTEVALVRIVQSGLANITSHADAAHARITLTYLADQVLLDIHDDGRGFDPDAITPVTTSDDDGGVGTGFGLVAMRQRLGLLGGSLTVDSEPGTGTILAAQIPVHSGSPSFADDRRATE